MSGGPFDLVCRIHAPLHTRAEGYRALLSVSLGSHQLIELTSCTTASLAERRTYELDRFIALWVQTRRG